VNIIGNFNIKVNYQNLPKEHSSILPCLKKTHLTRKIIVFGDKEKCENLFYLQKRSKFFC